jgi:membrane-associated phospholipid phosphatase
MRCSFAVLSCAFLLASPTVSTAQTVPAPVSAPASPTLQAPPASSFWEPFKQVPQDFVNLFSMDSARILGIGAAGAVLAHQWDDEGITMAGRRLQPVSNFRIGNIGGNFAAQVGGAFAVYSIGRTIGNERVAAVGGDLVRAQVLSQAVAQAMKFSFQRERPDGSNRHSLPSGHTASAVATATVLTRHFGWKVGIPAYAASAYVAASRMSASKHHISDLMLGAAVGVVAGRTVTIGTAKHRFAVGVAPTVGGAAFTITKQ